MFRYSPKEAASLQFVRACDRNSVLSEGGGEGGVNSHLSAQEDRTEVDSMAPSLTD